MEIIKAESKITAKDYIISHFADYGIESVKTADDMKFLLNILQAHGETLDTFHGGHDARDFFCDIYGNMADDDETAETLFDFHIFYETLEDFFNVQRENAIDYGISLYEVVRFETLTKTDDGYIYFIKC